MKILLPCGFVQCIAGIHCAMSSLTGQIYETSDQRFEQRESCIKLHLMNLATFQNWFEDYSPFINFTELIFIAHGVTASKELQVNCDETEK